MERPIPPTHSLMPKRFDTARSTSGRGLLRPVWIVALALVAFFAASLFGKMVGRNASFVIVCGAGLIGVLVLTMGYARHVVGNKAIFIAVAAFLIRIGLGIFNNHNYIDNQYFEADTEYSWIWDYEWLDQSMTAVANHWEKNGLLEPMPRWYWEQNKNPYLILYSSLCYYTGGVGKYLNFTPFNALHSIIVATFTLAMCMISGASRKAGLFVFGLMCFHPLGMFANIMWRDNAGQVTIFAGAYLMLAYRGRIVPFLISTAIAALLAFTLRQPYMLVVIAGGVVLHLTHGRSVATSTFMIGALIVMLMLSLNAHRFVMDAAMGRASSRGLTFGITTPLTYPFRFLRAVIGDFPWTQALDPNIPAYHLHPMNYLTSVFNATLLTLVIPKLYRNLRFEGRVDGMALFGLGYFMTGMLAPAIHVPYVNVGMPFLFCIASTECNVETRWWRTFILMIMFFLFLNIFYIMIGMSGTGFIRNLIYG